MKIKKVSFNNRMKNFCIVTSQGKDLIFPYSKLRLKPSQKDPMAHVFIDSELGKEAFTYQLHSGKEDSIHLDHILEYNKDPDTLKNILLYKMSLHAQKQIKKSKISKREIIRRMGTSPTQFYRLIDQANVNKTVDQMLKLLGALDCEVDLVIKKAA